jgi:hypothetical protein
VKLPLSDASFGSEQWTLFDATTSWNNTVTLTKLVMPGLVPGIHVLAGLKQESTVDGRDEPGHDDRSLGTIQLLIDWQRQEIQR